MVTRVIALSLFMMLPTAGCLADLNFAEQERAAIEQFSSELNQIKHRTDQRVDFTLKHEDFAFVKESAPQSSGTDAQPVADSRKVIYQVFVSWSLGEHEVKDMLVRYNGNKSVELVFRGIPEGMPFPQALAKLQKLALDTKSDTPVLINPVVFSEASVTVVPQIRKLEEGKVIYLVAGTTSISAADNEFNARTKTNLGSIGPTENIAERDLIEVLKERLAKLDFNELKENATKRFWDKQTFVDLPTATTHRVRRLNPTITVPEDMMASDGTLIHRAGEQINPLSIRPFTQRLVIIDPVDPVQVALAKEQIKKNADHQNVVVILTRVDRALGWDGFTTVQDQIGRAVYLLQDDVRTRFSIDYVPSVVTADTTNFYIEEFPAGGLK
ncbi:TrbC family F-type conjugative pilus assembly protein [Pseudomonas sp. Irchel 3E13]|uniref:TrbC family F-type conjugative pilus assembly protein n=1 Tax=Pseudomonas sp. Irchel 3E13 TaxID=2008975 RepID=UPI000BA3CB86|nr:TrbC family F-type conjugative pilus assembly protein [Pseudomonas sp. Irchel 3E13]